MLDFMDKKEEKIAKVQHIFDDAATKQAIAYYKSCHPEHADCLVTAHELPDRRRKTVVVGETTFGRILFVY